METMTSRLSNTLRMERKRRGLSQGNLAAEVGISRQSYAALESGASVPSTELALRLGAVLGRSVEALFRLADHPPETVEMEGVGVDATPTPMPPFPVRVARVGGRERAYPLRPGLWDGLASPDGVALERRGAGLRVRRLPSPAPEVELVAAGCDPAFPLVAELLRDRGGIRTLGLHSGSRQALAMLAAGQIHVAGVHLRDDASGIWNGPWVDRLVPFPCTRIGFATWAVDLLLPPGNPSGIQDLEDVLDPGFTFAQREVGSGTRAFVEGRLGEMAPGGPPAKVAVGHMAVGQAVAGGWADGGVAIRAAGRAWGLHGLPLVEERYDLVIPHHFLDLPAVGALLDQLRGSVLRGRVELLGGYDGEIMGEPA